MAELKPQHFQAVLDALPAGVKVQMQLNQGRTYLAGGFIREIVIGNKPRDIDIFVPNEAEAKRLSAEYADEYPDKKFKPWKSEFAYNFTAKGEFPIQWIFAVRYDPAITWEQHQYAVIDSFDFSMSKVAVWFESDDWHTFCNENFYEHVENRQLVFEPSYLDQGNLRALKRALKFAARGWTIDDENLATILTTFSPTHTREQVREALYPMYGRKNRTIQEVVVDPEFDEIRPIELTRWPSPVASYGTTTGRLSSNGLDLGEVRNVEIRASQPIPIREYFVGTTPSNGWRFVDNANGTFSVDIGTNPASEAAAQPTDNDNTQGQ